MSLHRASPLRRLLAGLTLVALAAGLFACAAGGSRAGGDDERVLVTLRDYAAGQLFELASESHTDRVTYYSRERGNAARKIQTDEVMELLVEQLDEDGFERYAQGGRAPSRPTPLVSRSIELEVGGQVSHWVVGSGSAPDERLAFNRCLESFLGLYNVSASYQSVENPHGHGFFDHAEAEAAAGRR